METGGDQPTWAVVQAKPSQERRASESLSDAGAATYLPRCIVRKGSRPVPLFPSYVFMTWRDDLWPVVRSARGVARLLTTGDRPSVVREGFVELLRSSEVTIDGETVVPLPEPEPRREFVKGDWVRLAFGPGCGQVGQVDWAKSGGRVQVLLSAMGRLVPVRTGQAALEAA